MDCPKKKCDLSCHSKILSSWAFSQSKMLYIVTGSDVEKGTRFCIGNSMVSSAIWEKTCTSEFYKYLNIARVRKTSAIWDLWKTYECFFFLYRITYYLLHEKPCYYLLKYTGKCLRQMYILTATTTSLQFALLAPSVV